MVEHSLPRVGASRESAVVVWVGSDLVKNGQIRSG